MTADVLLQRETAYDLAKAARAAFNAKCAEINQRHKDRCDERVLRFHRRFDEMRELMVRLRHARPRDEASVAALELEMRAYPALPLPATDDLEAERLAEVNAADQTLADAIREIRRRLTAGELPSTEHHI